MNTMPTTMIDQELRELLTMAHAQAMEKLVDIAWTPGDWTAGAGGIIAGPTELCERGRVKHMAEYIRRLEARLGGAPTEVGPPWLRRVIETGRLDGAQEAGLALTAV